MMHLISFLLILVSFSSIVALVIWIVSIVDYKCESNNEYAKISFDEFLAFYKSAPSKWDLYESHLEYSKGRAWYSLEKERIYFNTYSDYRKYKKWRKRNQKDQLEQSRNKRLLELTKLWSRDVNEHYQSSMDEISAMYKDNLELSKRYEENMKHIKQKYKIRDEDIVSYSIEPIDGARIIKTNGGSSVRIPMYELFT